MRISPVIVRCDDRSVAIVQVQDWIGQWIRYSKLAERWAEDADDDIDRSRGSPDDETPDHDIVPGLDEATGGNVSELRVCSSIQLVNLN